MKHNYHERKEARIDYALEKAGKNNDKSKSLFKKSQQIAEHIPLAQPILVGHHSEGHSRSDANKISNAMHNSVEADKKADYYADKARAIEENNAISSDDPDAVEKLEQKLNMLEKHQEFMKAANKYIRKNDKEAFLKLEGATEQLWIKLITPDFVNRTGYPAYKLTNNNGNIRRIQERLKILKEVCNKTTNEKIVKGIKVIENVEANRIQLIFPDVPSKKVRERLKKEFRFIWCPSENAWQRFLNNQGIWAAQKFMETYEEENTSIGTSNRAA
jgi:hypothetical protein